MRELGARLEVVARDVLGDLLALLLDRLGERLDDMEKKVSGLEKSKKDKKDKKDKKHCIRQLSIAAIQLMADKLFTGVSYV